MDLYITNFGSSGPRRSIGQVFAVAAKKQSPRVLDSGTQPLHRITLAVCALIAW